jgi:hypothetical protein
MFVQPVEFMQAPEGVIAKGFPSVIRLQSLDDCLSARVDPLNLREPASRRGVSRAGSLASPLVESSGTPARAFLKDWELGRLREIVGERGSKCRREFEREMVERRAEALQTVSDEKREFVGGENGGVDPGSVIAGTFRIGLLHDGLLCCFDPLGNHAFSLLQVVLRP